MKTYWISFADDSGNRGVCIVDAQDEGAALDRAKALGVCPGGEAMFFEMPPDASDEVERWGKDRLIAPEDLERDGYSKTGDLTEGELDVLRSHPGVSVICERHTGE